jgi:hypothetical protein
MAAAEADAGVKSRLVWVRNANMRVRPNPTSFPASLNTIVTDTQGTDGRPGNVQDQYWRTNAKDDGSVNTVAYANFFAPMPAPVPLVAPNNAQARFKDGDYEIHIYHGRSLFQC